MNLAEADARSLRWAGVSSLNARCIGLERIIIWAIPSYAAPASLAGCRRMQGCAGCHCRSAAREPRRSLKSTMQMQLMPSSAVLGKGRQQAEQWESSLKLLVVAPDR